MYHSWRHECSFLFPKNPCTTKLLSSLDMFLFSQAVNEPRHECGHTLDWIMFRPEDNVLRSTSVTQSISSDHVCAVCELCVAVLPDPAVYRESRNIRAIDRAAFRDDLCMLVSPELCPSTDDFNSMLQSLPEKHAPLRRRRVRADRLGTEMSRMNLKLLRITRAGLKDCGSKRQRRE